MILSKCREILQNSLTIKKITCFHPFVEVGLKRIQVCKNNMNCVQQAGLNPEFGVVIQDMAPGLRDT